MRSWALGRSGIYFSKSQSGRPGWAIQFFDLMTGQVTELFRKDGLLRNPSLAVSPDEEWLLYSDEPRPTSEVMLVENFR